MAFLKGELVIGINRAYEICDPTLLICMDQRLWGWIVRGELGEESRQKFDAFRGIKCWAMFQASMNLIPHDECYFLQNRADTPVGGNLANGIFWGSHGGYAALNLAIILGANPIYLLGYDMNPSNGKKGEKKWWHDGYPDDGQNTTVYDRFIKDFETHREALLATGRDVVNLNPKSGLAVFRKSTLGAEKLKLRRKPKMKADKTITVITPTGDRPVAFGLCQRWMEHQTRQPDQWIVVDDGKVPLVPTEKMQYVRREPKKGDPKHTLAINIETVLPLVKGDKILFMEDDEYYAPRYIEVMAEKLDEYEAVGIGDSKYYHLPTRSFAHNHNLNHASLAETGIRAALLPMFAEITNIGMEVDWLDCQLWRHIINTQLSDRPIKHLIFVDSAESLYVGMKGLPGRAGIGKGHQTTMYSERDSEDLAVLRGWIPRDYLVYLHLVQGGGR